MTKKSPKRAKIEAKNQDFMSKTIKNEQFLTKNKQKQQKKHLFLTQKSSKNDHFFVFFALSGHPLGSPKNHPGTPILARQVNLVLEFPT